MKPLLRTTVVILVVLFSVLLGYIVVMNFGHRAIVAFPFSPTLPSEAVSVGLIILVSVIVGVIFTSIIGLLEQIRLRTINRQMRRKVRTLEEEVDALRNIPLSEDLQDLGNEFSS